MIARWDSLEEMAKQSGPLHLALGVFDGVHVGHQEVIAEAVRGACADGGMAVVVTFSPHPIRVIAPQKAPLALLATLEEKARIVENLGVDGLLVIRFDRDFAKTNAEVFVRALVAGDVQSICVGEDWRFGSDRSGDVGMLRRLAEDCGFRLHAVAPIMWDGERVSSTRIRQAIRDGNFQAVEEMLGRPYFVSGIVVEGRKLGRELGFPTANVDLGDLQTPEDGVWIVKVAQIGLGIANLGMRPTVGGKGRLLEVHLLDFQGDLYGNKIYVRFLRYVRKEKKFSNLDELQRQITLDLKVAEDFSNKSEQGS